MSGQEARSAAWYRIGTALRLSAVVLAAFIPAFAPIWWRWVW